MKTSMIVAVAAAALALQPAAGHGADPSFKGKTVKINIGFDPGGGYDFYGRLVARHLGRHLAGRPDVVPNNMPGAAGMKAANYLYQVAPKDGTALGVVPQQVALAEALGAKTVQFKTAKFNWVGRVTSNSEVSIVWHSSKVKTIEDAKRIEIPVAASRAGSAAFDYPLVLNKVVGTKFKIISGYNSSSAMMLAMERGETEASLASWVALKTRKKEWLDKGTVRILVQYGTERHADLPNVPAMVELAANPEDRKILALYVSGAVVGRSIVAPPAMAKETVAALRRGFDAMLKDPQLLAEIKKTKADFDPLSGEKLQAVIEDMGNVSPALLARARAVGKP